MSGQKKSRTISVYLLKGKPEGHEIVKDLDSLQKYDVDLGSGRSGSLYLKPPKENPPTWLSFFDGALHQRPTHKNSSASAIMIVEHIDRVFAIPFGYGHNLLLPGSYEPNFGLHVVLNSIDEKERIRGIQRTSIDGVPQQSRVQASRESLLTDFNLDIEQHILRGIDGRPIEESLGTLLSGKDSLTATVRAKITELPTLLERWFAQSQLKTYQQSFGFVDHTSEIRDPTRTAQLENLLAEKLSTQSLERIWLAPPEMIEWEYSEGFAFSQAKAAKRYDDLHIREFLSHVGEMSKITPAFLKNRCVYFYRNDSGAQCKSWSVFKCLYAEIEIEGKCHLLTNGCWYEIEPNFMNRVNDSIQKLTGQGDLPPFKHKDEKAYNQFVNLERPDMALMDCKEIRTPLAASPVEFCDLYSLDKKIIHVKRYSGSSTLSHHFAQGLVSATLFLQHQEFRELVNGKLASSHKLLDSAASPQPGEYTIVFAVVSKSTKPLQLPFFSRVNLRNVARQLSPAYKVQLIKIEDTGTLLARKAAAG